MKTVLSLVIIGTLFIFSCGKKEDPPKVEQQQQQQQQTQQQPQQQTQTDTKKQEDIQLEQKKIDDAKKELEKKEQEKKKEAEKKKQEDTVKKVDEKKPVTDGIDFSQIWPKKCFKCHGKDGHGKVEGVPDLTRAETKKKSEAELIKIISNGVKGKTEDDEDMPAWKNKLSEDEIKAAAKYVKGL